MSVTRRVFVAGATCENSEPLPMRIHADSALLLHRLELFGPFECVVYAPVGVPPLAAQHFDDPCFTR